MGKNNPDLAVYKDIKLSARISAKAYRDFVYVGKRLGVPVGRSGDPNQSETIIRMIEMVKKELMEPTIKFDE